MFDPEIKETENPKLVEMFGKIFSLPNISVAESFRIADLLHDVLDEYKEHLLTEKSSQE